MTLDLQDFDVLDWVKDDDGLSFLLNDALESRDETLIVAVVSDIERAKSLTADETMSIMARVMRAADAIGMQLAGVPHAA